LRPRRDGARLFLSFLTSSRRGGRRGELDRTERERNNFFVSFPLPLLAGGSRPFLSKTKLPPSPFLPSFLPLSLDTSLQRAAADFLWADPLPEAPAAADERRNWRLARSGRACVLRGAPLAARLVAPAPAPPSSPPSPSPPAPWRPLQQLSLEAIAEMEGGGGRGHGGGEGGDGDSDEDGDGGGAGAAARRRPPPRRIPATLLAAGPRAPPELWALDERKNSPGSHYRIRFPPTTKRSEGLEGGEGSGGGGGGSKGVLSPLAAAASAWDSRPSLLTARLLTGGGDGGEASGAAAPAGGSEEDGDEALRRLVREGIDWGWLSSLAGEDNDGADGDGGGGASPSFPPPAPSCWLPPSAVDCEWAGAGAAGCLVLPASYATHDRVFAQVRGVRRVLVARPRDALEK